MVNEILKQFTYIHIHCTNVCVFTDEYILSMNGFLTFFALSFRITNQLCNDNSRDFLEFNNEKCNILVSLHVV